MFAVEIYAAVRRFVFIEGNSRREAARVFGLSRDTIAKMCRYSAPPGYVRTKAPERPKLGPLLPVIDAILESDKTAPPKQRHTAKRIFERLRDEHGFAGGYTVVKDYVRLARMRSREVFVPLIRFPADYFALAIFGHQWNPARLLMVSRSLASATHLLATISSSSSIVSTCLLTMGSSTSAHGVSAGCSCGV
jgi:hypothetical protein